MRLHKLQRNFAIIYLALLLGGCGVDDDLFNCVSTTEPTILLRQLSLTGERRKMLDGCLDMFTEEYCRALLVGADGLVRACMERRGYTFDDKCAFKRYSEAECYKSTWSSKVKGLIHILP
jgi:hypothetical protein